MANIKIQDLEVQSFVIKLDANELNEVQGGCDWVKSICEVEAETSMLASSAFLLN